MHIQCENGVSFGYLGEVNKERTDPFGIPADGTTGSFSGEGIHRMKKLAVHPLFYIGLYASYLGNGRSLVECEGHLLNGGGAGIGISAFVIIRELSEVSSAFQTLLKIDSVAALRTERFRCRALCTETIHIHIGARVTGAGRRVIG
jgi:hypothetical protein